MKTIPDKQPFVKVLGVCSAQDCLKLGIIELRQCVRITLADLEPRSGDAFDPARSAAIDVLVSALELIDEAELEAGR